MVSVRSVFVIKRADGLFQAPSGAWGGIVKARVFSEKRHANLSIAQSKRDEQIARAVQKRHWPDRPERAPEDHGEPVELLCSWPESETA